MLQQYILVSVFVGVIVVGASAPPVGVGAVSD